MRIGPDHSRPGLDTCQLWTPAWAFCRVVGPECGRPGPHPGGGGSGSHSRGPVRTGGGPGPTWRSGLHIQGSDTFPWGSGLTVDALEYISFSGHVAAPGPPTWWGQVLLLAQSSRPRLGRVIAWSHVQLLYHATKDSCVGTRLHTVVRGTLVSEYRQVLTRGLIDSNLISTSMDHPTHTYDR
jgi:hypothetical protein